MVGIQWVRDMNRVALILFLCTAAVAARTASENKPAPTSSSSSAAQGTAPKSVKADSVTINLPEGMTKDQADAILTELKAIHQLLLNQQNAAATSSAAAARKCA